MKKYLLCLIFAILVLLSQSAFANDVPNAHIELDENTEYELMVSYRNGPPLQSHAVINFEMQYIYETKEIEEIRKIVDCFNSMELTHTDEKGKLTDATYFRLHLGDNDQFKISNGKTICNIEFTEQLGLCKINDKFYRYNTEELEKLKEVIYPFRTKNDTKVYANNELIKPVTKPVIIDGRTLIPLRDLCDALGIEDVNVEINRTTTKQLTISKDGKTAVFVTDQNYMLQNGEKVELDVGCKFSDNYIFIPVRVLMEYFGYSVEWKNKSVYIS